MRVINIQKASGEKEAYDRGKFCRSVRRSGASPEVVQRVCSAVEKGLRPGMTTSEIFREASRHLMRLSRPAGLRYQVKRGMFRLGPAGFVFEQFVEIILREEGYHTRRGAMVRGKCISHEVDVYAQKRNEVIVVEAKYHNSPRGKTTVEPVMYAEARTHDLKRAPRRKKNIFHTALFTNTSFTGSAIRYARCENIRLTSWDYPKNNSLSDLISRYSLHPITILPSVDRKTLEIFSQAGVMLARDLAPYSPERLKKHFGIETLRAKKIMADVSALFYHSG